MLVIDANIALEACGEEDGFRALAEDLAGPPLMWSEARANLHLALIRQRLDRRGRVTRFRRERDFRKRERIKFPPARRGRELIGIPTRPGRRERHRFARDGAVDAARPHGTVIARRRTDFKAVLGLQTAR
jgi:hypothetical protein